MQNYTHRTKPTEYILQQKKEIRRRTLPSAETAAENALCAEQAKNRVNTRPSRAKAKYGAVNGVCAPFFFSAVVTDRIPQGGTFVLSLWGEWHLCTLPLGRVRASQTAGRRSAARRAEALHPLTFFEKKVSKETLIFNERNFMKDKKLSIRISEQDLTAIHRKANTANLSVTDYVTRSCLNKQIVVVDGLENIIREQKAIGKNLNRLTLLCNMGRVSVADLSEVKNEYARLNELLCSLLDRKRWQ